MEYVAHSTMRRLLVRFPSIDLAFLTVSQPDPTPLPYVEGDLQDCKLAPAFLCDLQECVARHVLDAREGLFHELKQLVGDSLQEAPVGAQEAGILGHDEHDVARNDRLEARPCIRNDGREEGKQWGSDENNARKRHDEASKTTLPCGPWHEQTCRGRGDTDLVLLA